MICLFVFVHLPYAKPVPTFAGNAPASNMAAPAQAEYQRQSR